MKKLNNLISSIKINKNTLNLDKETKENDYKELEDNKKLEDAARKILKEYHRAFEMLAKGED